MAFFDNLKRAFHLEGALLSLQSALLDLLGHPTLEGARGHPQPLGGGPGAEFSLLEGPEYAPELSGTLDGGTSQLGAPLPGPLQALGLAVGQLRPAVPGVLGNDTQNLFGQSIVGAEGTNSLLIFR